MVYGPLKSLWTLKAEYTDYKTVYCRSSTRSTTWDNAVGKTTGTYDTKGTTDKRIPALLMPGRADDGTVSSTAK